MTDKSDFDWWIKRDRDTCNAPCDSPVSGTRMAIREQLWFRWSSPAELRDKVIEVVACYPNRSLADENEDRLEAIWDRAASVLSEQVSIDHDDVPQHVRDGLFEELKEGRESPRRTQRWQHPAGFRCFMNRGVPEWSANLWVETIDYEGVLHAPTAIECRVLQHIADVCGNQPLSEAIKAAYSLRLDSTGAAQSIQPVGNSIATKSIASGHIGDQGTLVRWTPESRAKLLNEHILLRQKGVKSYTKLLAKEYGIDDSFMRVQLRLAKTEATANKTERRTKSSVKVASNRLGNF